MAERKKFEWTSKMTAVTAIFALFLMIVQTFGTVGNWLKVPVTFSQRMSNLEDAKGIATTQITALTKENTLAHEDIKAELNVMNGRLENLCGQMNILVGMRERPTVWMDDNSNQNKR